TRSTHCPRDENPEHGTSIDRQLAKPDTFWLAGNLFTLKISKSRADNLLQNRGAGFFHPSELTERLSHLLTPDDSCHLSHFPWCHPDVSGRCFSFHIYFSLNCLS